MEGFADAEVVVEDVEDGVGGVDGRDGGRDGIGMWVGMRLPGGAHAWLPSSRGMVKEKMLPEMGAGSPQSLP